MTKFTVKCPVIACKQTAHDTKSRGNICVKGPLRSENNNPSQVAQNVIVTLAFG